MSIAAMRIVWSLDIQPPSKKLVLLALADHLNEETGRLDPSVRRVGLRCGMSEKQARRHLHDLQKDGLVEVVGGSTGGANACRYKLNLNKSTTPIHGSPPTDGSPPISDRPPLPPMGAHPSQTREPTTPTDGSRIIKNLKIESEKNLSLGKNRLEREELGNDAVHDLLTMAGWMGRLEQAEEIARAYALFPISAVGEAIAKAKVHADSWPRCTSWLLINAERLASEEATNRCKAANLPPGKKEELVLKAQDDQARTQMQTHQQLSQALFSLPQDKLLKLQAEFLKSKESIFASKALASDDGWRSSSAALWGPFAGWLKIKYPDVFCVLTQGAPETCST